MAEAYLAKPLAPAHENINRMPATTGMSIADILNATS